MKEVYKKVYKNRLAEFNYDSSKEIEHINKFFDKNINNETYRRLTGGVTTYHIDYGDILYMEHWKWLTKMFEKLMKDMGCKLDFNEFRHTLKYSFIQMEPNSVMGNHTAAFVRAMCSINIPLRGITKIDLYEDNKEDPHTSGDHIVKHHYTSPIILGVNQFHGVINDCDQPRMILKVHIPIILWEKVFMSFYEEVKVFSHDVPWSYERGSYQMI